MSWLVRRTILGYRKRPEALTGIFEWTSYHSQSRWPSLTACASKSLKVAIIGANGYTGRCLALSLKQSPIIDELAVYDTTPTPGLILELSHIASRCRTICHEDDDRRMDNRQRLERTLRGAKVVAICLENEYLYEQASYLQTLIPSLVACCPKAFVALLSRSVNSLLPMLFEFYKMSGVFEEGRLFGVTNLYTIRANKYAAEVLGIDPEFVSVPVVGGGCARTCIPVFSQTRPCGNFTPEESSKLMDAMKNADVHLIKAYGPSFTNLAESSAFSTGFAAARFCISLCKALRDESRVFECAYVRCCLLPELKYMTVPLELGPCGIQRYMGLPKLTSRECAALHKVLPEIWKAIALGESLVLGERASTEVCPVQPCCTALQVYQADVVT